METIGRYVVIRALGQGGEGGVWLVQDPLDAKQRWVALKTVGEVSQGDHQAIRNEFLVLSALQQRGVPPVYDFGILTAGSESAYYYTRRHEQGSTLAEHLSGVSIESRLDAMADLLETVAPLHRRGVVHGDIKPSNIIVGVDGMISVIDFGLARHREQAAAQKWAGTPAFMAPELMRGASRTARSDVYALGGVLVEALLGHGAFHRGEFDEARLDEVSSALVPVVKRACAPQDLDRYPDAREMLLAYVAAANLSDRGEARPFVPPSPRLSHPLLEELGRRTEAAGSITALRGASRSGRSSYLRALKWQEQMNGTLVLSIQDTDVPGVIDVVRSLSLQLQGAGPTEEGSRSVTDLLEAVRLVTESRRVMVIADDLDEYSQDVVTLLERLITSGGDLRLVYSCRIDSTDMLQPDHTLQTQNLNRDQVKLRLHEVLGPVDAALVDSVTQHTGGIAGVVVRACRELYALGSPGARDVERLAVEWSPHRTAVVRFESSGVAEKTILKYLAALQTPVELEVLRKLVDDFDEAWATLDDQGVVSHRQRGGTLVDRSMGVAVRASLLPADLRSIGKQLIENIKTPSLVQKARLGVLLGAERFDASTLASLVDELLLSGAAYDALTLLGEHERTVMRRAQILYSLGEFDATVATLGEDTLKRGEFDDRKVMLARTHIAQGDLKAAGRILESIEPVGDGALAAGLWREQVRLQMRLGRYVACIETAEKALKHLSDDALEMVEVLTSLGLSQGYAGNWSAGQETFERAMKLAETIGDARDCRNVFACMAIGQQRVGDLRQASDLHAKCVAFARKAGDAGGLATSSLNLGGVELLRRRFRQAEQHLRVAISVSSRIGKRSTLLLARGNLAVLCADTGRYEEAQSLAEGVRTEAEGAGARVAEALALQVLGEVACRRGEFGRAKGLLEATCERFAALSQGSDLRASELDLVEVLIGLAEMEAARRLLDDEPAATHSEPADLSIRAGLWRARLTSMDGEHASAQEKLVQLRRKVDDADEHALVWLVAVAQAEVEIELGNSAEAARFVAEALGALEGEAAMLSPDLRGAFWGDPRRRRVREMLTEQRRTQRADVSMRQSNTRAGTERTPLRNRELRLLEITIELASEDDVERLLTLITDAAVEISGAERGIVLTVERDGELRPCLVRNRGMQVGDPHVAFSRSIAESVLIDGEAIITVDASEDTRLSEYLSVHQLMLKSVVALPIRGRGAVLGVLYLEHRLVAARFAEVEIELLEAFCAQAAISIENARVLVELGERNRELEVLTSELAEAKLDVDRALAMRTDQLASAKLELEKHQAAESETVNQYGMVGRSSAIREVLSKVERVAHSDVSVVVHGESGTGKELVARAVHIGGGRSSKPFIAINCAAVPDTLIESTLFGHVRGAFTGAERDRAGVLEQASGGTLFLDEVGDMPAKMQVDLLRVLQEGRVRRIGGESEIEVDTRIICASHRKLSELVQAGSFRQDLFYRLHVVEIVIPPLRERRDDIPLLVEHFLRAFARTGQTLTRKRITRETMLALQQLELPGNVRQLEHILLNACIMGTADEIEVKDFGLDAVGQGAGNPREGIRDDESAVAAPIAPDVENVHEHKKRERDTIIRALEEHGWNRAKAARQLGIPRRTFYRRLKEHGIQ